MGSRARAPLARLADVLDAPVANQTALGTLLRALSVLRNNASAAASAADNLRRPLATLNLDAFMKVRVMLSVLPKYLFYSKRYSHRLKVFKQIS